ncbi:MAG TPA: hypothetical protein VNS88_14015 [Nitrospiraceae bacterium]|nr:hypothetical protein [Nitrospiraceae bacterium]
MTKRRQMLPGRVSGHRQAVLGPSAMTDHARQKSPRPSRLKRLKPAIPPPPALHILKPIQGLRPKRTPQAGPLAVAGKNLKLVEETP